MSQMMPFWVISFMMLRYLLFVVLVLASQLDVTAQGVRVINDVWNGRPIRLVANTLRVRLQPGLAYSIDQVRSLLPPGIRVRDQLLQPQQARRARYELLRLGQGAMQDPLYRAEEQLLRTFTVTFDGPVLPQRMAATLAADTALFESVEPWYVDELQETPNDPYLADQAYLPVIRALDAWDVYSGDSTMVIAVCDNGVDQTHEDLAGNLFTRTAEVPNNGVDDDKNGFVDDYQGYNLAWEVDGNPGSTSHGESHGTEVAGIAGASWNNGKGIAGIAGHTRIMPLKASIRGSNGVVFGYQGILYAAMNGAAVVNCSWGAVKPFSLIDQSVIDYATARGTLVVASAGNHGAQAGGSPYDRNYPSSYQGVLGVGETTLLDRVTSTSGLGVNADVFAPGFQAYTTTTFNGYTSFGVQGTSFASPMVAAAAALVRGRYPTLTPAQTAAVLRHTATSIAGVNASIQAGLAGRLDIASALTQQPMSAPGIDVTGYRLLSAGSPTPRLPVGVPLTLQIDLINHLGAARGVVAEARVLARNGWDVDLLTPNVEPIDLPSGARKAAPAGVMTIRSQGEQPLLLAVQIAAEGTYEDQVVVMIDPDASMTTLSNGVLTYSIGDAGSLGVVGSYGARQGRGFVWSGGYWMLSPSGIMVTEGDTRAVTGMNDLALTSDFTPEKRFVEPDTNVGTMTDANAPADRRIGVRIHTRATFHPVHPEATVIEVQVANVSGRVLQDVAVGYVLDWDLGSGGDFNRSRIAPEAIPATFAQAPFAAQVFYRTVPPARVAVMCGVASIHDNAKPQTAAFPWSDFLGDGLSSLEMVELLRNNASIQTDYEGDLAGAAGMRFPGALQPNEQRTMMMVIAVASTIDSAAAVMRDVLTNPMDVTEMPRRVVRMMPNPATDAVRVHHGEGIARLTVVDVRGLPCASATVLPEHSVSAIDVSALPSGIYNVIAEGAGQRTSLPLTILR